jgi:hypothetical protein
MWHGFKKTVTRRVCYIFVVNVTANKVEKMYLNIWKWNKKRTADTHKEMCFNLCDFTPCKFL